MPKVSVVMPAYNAEKYIGEAIDSILNQTFSDFEFIIIDDGSSDGTVDIIKGCTDPRIRFYQNEHNMGVAETLNRGLDLATGEYIARMDSDDISLPQRFEKQVAYLNENINIAVCGGNAVVFSETKERKSELPLDNKSIKYNMFISSPFFHPSVMMRKAIIDSNSLRYESEYDGREDYRLWMRFALLQCEFYNINEPILKYRVHDGQATKRKEADLIEKHTKLKKWYLDRTGIPYSEAELNALCLESVGVKLKNENDLFSLKSIFMAITRWNNDSALPDLYQSILLKKSVLLGVSPFALFNDQPIKEKIILTLRAARMRWFR